MARSSGYLPGMLDNLTGPPGREEQVAAIEKARSDLACALDEVVGLMGMTFQDKEWWPEACELRRKLEDERAKRPPRRSLRELDSQLRESLGERS